MVDAVVVDQGKTIPGSRRVFLRLLRLLRPHYRIIGLGLLLLILLTPCELFPALAWIYVADDLLGAGHGKPTPVLSYLVSLGGSVHWSLWLLLSALIWMF